MKGLVYLSRYLDQLETAKGPFQSSSQAATCYYQSNHSKVEAIPLSVLPKDTTSKLAGLSSHYPFFMLNVKQESCKYQLLKSFNLTRFTNSLSLAENPCYTFNINHDINLVPYATSKFLKEIQNEGLFRLFQKPLYTK